MITVDDEILRDSDKQLGNNLIAVLNVGFSLRDGSPKISTLNDDENNPGGIVMLNTVADTM